VAAGAWSARKKKKGWEGIWQARAGNGALFAGTWSVRSPLEASAALTDLLELALNNVVTGAWQAGRKSGGWSIRAFRTR
jgi:predicted exporter